MAFTIFAIVVSVSSSVFLDVSRSFRFFIGYLHSQNNLRFVMESMTREIKEGYNYQEVPNGFRFTNDKGKTITYAVSEGRLFRREGEVELPVTDARLNVNDFSVVLVCAGGGSCQPRVTFIIRISPRFSAIDLSRFSFTLQTTITQRRLAI